MNENQLRISELEKLMEGISNKDKVPQYEAYMRNQFKYIGAGTVNRRNVTKEIIDEIKSEKEINWDFVFLCFEHEKREFQNIAVDYLISSGKKLQASDTNNLKILVQTKSWWDTVDELAHVAGILTKLYPETKGIMLEWSTDQNIWVRRISILHQLMKKNNTDTLLLSKIILNNLGSKEFFINKAIGWALRDYSYANPEWVKSFIENHKDKLSSLSVREGSKRINKQELKGKK